MKNFTNNFKQFTSRLSARWLIMVLMLLVGTSSAWGWTIYFVNNKSWSSVNCYAWTPENKTWPGVAMTKESYKIDGYDVYTYSNTNNSIKNCIFNNGSGEQTGDLSITDGKYYYDGKGWIDYCSSCCTNYYVAGDAGLCGENWNVNADKMTCSDNVWTKTFTNVNNGTYYFQITNGTWDVKKGEYDNSKGNITLSNVDDGYGAKKIKLTTTSKGDITISFDGSKAWVDFVQPCFTASDVEPGSISSNVANNAVCGSSQVTLTLSNTTTKEGLSQSIQWQKKSGIEWNDIPNATNPEYEESVSVTTEYRAKVTWTKTGCDNIVEYANESGFTVTVNALPSAPGLKTASSIKVCPGNLTLANYVNVASGTTVLWFTDEDCTQSANSPSIAAGERKVFYAKAKNTSTGCLSAGKTTLTITAYSAPADFTLTAIPTEICSGADVVISISDKQDGVTYKLGETEINESITVNPTQTTTYTVVASLDACPALTNSISTTEIVVNPIPSFVTAPSNLSLCKGATNETNLTDLSHVEVANGVAVWYDSETGGKVITKANLEKSGTYWVAAENSTTGCINPERKQFTLTINELPKYPELGKKSASLCQSNETEDLDKLAEINDVVWYIGENEVNNAHEISLTTVGTTTYTAKAVDANGCQSATGAEFVLTIDAQPTITAPAATQTNKEVKLTSAAGASTQWSVSPTENVTLTDNGDGTATFSASVIGDFVVYAKNGTCSTEYPITVTDKGNIIYVRRPKSEDGNNYTYWYNSAFMGEEYYGTQNYIKNGADFSTASENNKNGTAPTVPVAFTDCDGYVWDKFEVLGYESFFVHAPVQTGFGGYSTFTQTIDVALGQPEMYVTIGTWSSGLGAPITKVEAPSLVKVHALGSTTLGADKFAALYVTDCSGKEIDAYQWEYCRTQDGDYQPYSSVCSYTFEKKDVVKTETSDAGKTNNIRPSELGYYRCTVTYEDRTTATSAAVEISGSYNPFTSTIPVLVVNTGNKDFPGCQATGTDNYPSKYADDLKAKRSVDVKIYDEKGALVYDRKARMAYRGSSSLNFTKKSYAFCPGDANCGDKDKGEDYVKTAKLNMLGVGKACDKDWVLYAAAADPSLMRNRMVFDTYQAMRPNDWGVHSRYVELIINGEYKGVYVFMDKITMNKERVKVDEDKGFIVKFDKTDCADRVGGYNGILGDEKTFNTKRTGRYGISTYHTTVDQLFEIEYPEKDDYPTGWANKVASIKEMFQAFENALEEGDYATVQKYIDYDSWADWFIINEFTKNLDAYRASCIFVYTGEAGAKIEARPLWDQELSFNNAAAGLTGKGANSTSGLLIQNDGVYTDCFPAPFWFTGQLATFGTCGGNNGSGAKGEKLANCLLNDPCFVQVVKEKWNQHQLGALSAEALGKLITKYDDELGYTEKSGSTILKRESTKWPDGFRTSADCSAGGTGYNEVSYSDSKTAIKSWIADGAGGRREGLTTAINGLTGASFSIQIIPSVAYTTPWEPVEIAVSVTPAGYDYKLEYTGNNNLGSVANTIIKEEGDKIIYRIPRPWDSGDAEEGERTDIEYGIKATLSVQEGTTVCGSQAAPTSTAKIILQDEPNDECPQP